jgi:dGTP triphosphohydrolase
MTTTIELAKEAGFADWYGTDDIAFLALLDIFRALCVAERDKELLAVGMGPVAYRYTEEVSSGAYSEPVLEKRVSLNRYFATYKDAEKLYTATQLAAARLQGAEEERKKWQDNLHANVEYCPTCCEGKTAVPDMTRDEVIFQCGKTSGRLQGQKRIAELEQQLAEKREPLTQQQVVDAFCNLPHNVQYIGVFDAGVRFAEKHHNIGGKHD